jgi:hypothetical protein
MNSIKKRAWWALLAVFMPIFVVSSHSLFAQSSQLQVTLCDVNGPSVTLSEPNNGTVTQSSQITIAGQAQQTTYIDFYLNNMFNQDVVILPEGNFSTSLNLQKGENIITYIAYQACNNTNLEGTRTVYYVDDLSNAPSTSYARSTFSWFIFSTALILFSFALAPAVVNRRILQLCSIKLRAGSFLYRYGRLVLLFIASLLTVLFITL